LLRNYLFLSLGMAFTGATVAISKPLAAVMPVFLLGLLRCVLAAAALLPFVLTDLPGTLKAAKSARTALIGQTVTGIFLFTSFLFFGVRHSAALTAGIITATLPAAVALLSVFWLRERLGGLQAAGVGLSVLGIGLLNMAGLNTGVDGVAAATLLGTLLLVLAVFSEAFYTIFAKQTAEHIRPLPTAFVVNILGACLFLPFGLVQALTFDWAQMTPYIWFLVFCFALGSSVFALVFWYQGVRDVAANVAGLFTAVVPVSAGAVALLLLGEVASRQQMAGAVLVVLAILLGARGKT
jgi:drug/metabolite transporter (DMT)-like permease